MYLSIDLQSKASPINFNTNGLRFSWFTRIGRFLIDYFKSRIHKTLDEMILEVEGFYKHIPELSTEETIKILKSTKTIINILDRNDELLKSINYMDDKRVGIKFKYALKTLYRLESLLHIESTRGVEIEKTDATLVQGLVGVSILSVSKSVYI